MRMKGDDAVVNMETLNRPRSQKRRSPTGDARSKRPGAGCAAEVERADAVVKMATLTRPRSQKRRSPTGVARYTRGLLHAFLALVCLGMLYPLLWMSRGSILPEDQIFSAASFLP